MRTGSPCINVCLLDPEARICVGCGRTIAEIGGWSALDPAQRRKVEEVLTERLRGLRPRSSA